MTAASTTLLARSTIKPLDAGEETMSLGGGPLDNQDFQARVDHLAAKGDAHRAARMAGYKSPFRRLLDRLRPHRQQPSADPHMSAIMKLSSEGRAAIT